LIINRIAIIGLGSIGRRHLSLILKIKPNIEIILVRSGYGNTYKEEEETAKTVYSISDAIKLGIQAAIISSPATLHVEQALELAKNGVHLLIEKPLSNELSGAHELLNEINHNNKDIVVMIGYVLRYDIGAIKFNNWLKNKITGDILHARIECGSYLPDWRPDQDYKETVSALSKLGGGALLELSHELDYLYWFFGCPVDVQANLRNSKTLDIDVEDQVDLLLTSKAGYPIVVQVDFNRRYPKRECTVITTDGELIWDAVKKNVTLRTINNEPCVYNYNYDYERDYIYQRQLEVFFDCIVNNNKPTITIEDGVNVMRLIDASHNAYVLGKKIIL
jgi:predicted dehydrogenase